MGLVHGPGCNTADRSFGVIPQREKPGIARDYGVAVALGGGFCRGFAHLGVLEVLGQERIPIAGIVGTSIGSLLGAAYADGISTRELCRFGRRVRIRDFVKMRSPRGAVDGTGRIGQFVRDWFLATRIEELPIPTAIVATNLENRAPYVFSQGPLDVAIRASCAFPGLFDPVQHEGYTLADGCIAAPVPTETAARMNASCVLAVDVSVTGASEISPGDTWSSLADIVIEPDVQGLDWNDFARVDDAREAGAQAMRHALPGLRELLARRRKTIPIETRGNALDQFPMPLKVT